MSTPSSNDEFASSSTFREGYAEAENRSVLKAKRPLSPPPTTTTPLLPFRELDGFALATQGEDGVVIEPDSNKQIGSSLLPEEDAPLQSAAADGLDPQSAVEAHHFDCRRQSR